jgi:glutamate N-acetyltransferase/amino-acid N-acetyltransferase
MYGEVISQGTVTSPRGFVAGATYVGLKTRGENLLDLGILYSQVPCGAAGIFTTNRVKAAPVTVSQLHLANGQPRAIVVNSGCANACTGQEGYDNAMEMAHLTAHKLGLRPVDVLVASTGVIGVQLPMDKIRQRLPLIAESTNGGHELARAIVTTDTYIKEIAVSFQVDGCTVTIGGIAKGARMIHPDLATLLSFLTTDAAVEPQFLMTALREAADASFNMATIDGDTSTNDSLILFANGLAGNNPIQAATPAAAVFVGALTEVCVHLAKLVARDGEGATKLIEVLVTGAESLQDARIGARTIASSMLVKSAVHGNDPNWGRILAALGRSGAAMREGLTDVFIGETALMRGGTPQVFDHQAAVALLSRETVQLKVDLHLGPYQATAWGCDLSEEYVTFNSDYTT